MSTPGGQWAWHVHHTILAEKLNPGGIVERQEYIRLHKPSSERPRRLRLLKLVGRQVYVGYLFKALEALEGCRRFGDNPTMKAAVRYLRQRLTVLHKQECKNCPWDGHTIFPERRKKNG